MLNVAYLLFLGFFQFRLAFRIHFVGFAFADCDSVVNVVRQLLDFLVQVESGLDEFQVSK